MFIDKQEYQMTKRRAVLSIFTMAVILTHASGCVSSHETNSPLTTDACAHDDSQIAASEAQPTFRIDTPDALRDTLLDQYERDQEIRTVYSQTLMPDDHHEDGHAQSVNEADLMSQLWAVDQESIELLKAMISKYGWPSYDMIGENAAKAAWLLAQHADADPEFQEQVLSLMKPLVEQSQADGRLFAMLTDRVLTNKNQPQIYGSQFAVDDEGVSRPLPVRDFDHIDTRRADVGLNSIREYADQIGAINGNPTDIVPMSAFPVYEFDD